MCRLGKYRRTSISLPSHEFINNYCYVLKLFVRFQHCIYIDLARAVIEEF